MTSADLRPPADAVRTRTCDLWKSDIVVGQFLENAEVTGDDARENLAVIAQLTHGGRLPVLVDLRAIRSQSAEARAVFAGPAATRVTIAVALLIDSPVSRVLGNFYLGFNKPQTPSRLFTSVSSAREWLATFQPTAHAG